MGSYYRDPLPFNPQHHQSTFHAQQQPALSQQDADVSHGPTRLCSVRGCTVILPFEYSLKMCEQCRGRHRIYANTKRQKRKMEKLALGGQRGPVVWMPPNEGQDDLTPSPDLSPRPHQREAPPTTPNGAPEHPAPVVAEPDPLQEFIPTTHAPWDNSAIDPRLFSQTSASSSSELAGALSFPVINPTTPPQAAHTTQNISSTVSHAQNSPAPPTAISPNAVQFMSQHISQGDSFPAQQRSELPSSTSQAQISSQPTFSADIPAPVSNTSLPHRYCSIKGCKSVIAGDSFFKMCEPCRDRYRNYGTTKRAKWRREKEAAVAELQTLRVEEDKRRAEHGLPPLPRDEIEWQDIPDGALGSATHATRSPYAQVVPSHAPRMCTVSHCREILPAEYEYLRCERHRIQNRHHSKLKRVRDKESKALAFDDWAAAVDAMSQKNEDAEDEGEDVDEHEDNGGDTTEGGLEGIGMPPAARGSRRTNHVCSIKVCNNLLSPSNPWKMCDSCRSRDRTARKIKALRESGVPVEPVPLRMKSPPTESAEKKTKRKRKKAEKTDEGDDSAGQHESSSSGSGGGSESASTIGLPALPVSNQSEHPGMPFMNPLLPDQLEQSSSIVSGTRDGTVQPQDTITQSVATVEIPQPIPVSESVKPPHKRKSSKKKKDTSDEPPVGEPATVSVPAIAGTSTTPQPPVPVPHIQPAYHVPYYMPPPFTIPPYAPGRLGAPPVMYSRDPYAPNPMYHPSYPYPYPYPPPPPGYGFPPPPYPMPMPPSHPLQLPPGPGAAPEQLPTPPQGQSGPSPAAVPDASPHLPPPPAPSPPTQAIAFSPFSHPLDVSTMYSTFSSRSKDDTTAAPFPSNTHTNHTPYGSEIAAPPAEPSEIAAAEPLKLTFHARTGQTYTRPEPVPGLGVLKMKRMLVEPSGGDGTSAKRVEVQGAGGETRAASAHSEQSDGIGQNDSPKSVCGSKTCHRVLPANAVGSLCEKCKERVRKKQVKAKQRFKLEPKKTSIIIIKSNASESDRTTASSSASMSS